MPSGQRAWKQADVQAGSGRVDHHLSASAGSGNRRQLGSIVSPAASKRACLQARKKLRGEILLSFVAGYPLIDVWRAEALPGLSRIITNDPGRHRAGQT